MSAELCPPPAAHQESRRIIGSIDVYDDYGDSSDNEDTCTESNSVINGEKRPPISQHIDSRFQQIMTNLSTTATGQVLTSKMMAATTATHDDYCTDLESIKTEDIETEFRSTLILGHRVSESSVVGLSSRSKTSPLSPNRRRRRVGGPPNKSTSGVVGIGDDFDDGIDQSEVDFRAGHQPRDSGRSGAAATATPPNATTASASYKHVANVPMTSFDRFIVDSDADTVTSHDVREQFRVALAFGPKAKTNMADILSVDDSGDEDDVVSRRSTYADEFSDNGSRNKSPVDTKHHGTTPSDNWRWAESPQGSPTRRKPARTTTHANEMLQSPQKRFASHRSDRSSLSISEDDVSVTVSSLSVSTAAASGGHSRYNSPVHSSGPAAVVSRSSSADRRHQKQSAGDHVICADRKMSPVSTPSIKSNSDRLAIENKVDLEVSVRLQHELSNLHSEIKKCIQSKQNMQDELHHLEQMVEKRKQEVRSTEKQMKETNKKAEECRSELMLIEFKQQATRQDLEQLSNGVNQRRLQLQQLETSEKKLQELGFTKEEVTRLILECEELKEKMRQFESSEKEKLDLGDQLTITKETLVAERKDSRDKLNSVKQELDAKNHQIEELKSENDSLQQKIGQLDLKCKQIEKDKNNFAKETSQEYNNFRTQMEQQMAISRENNSKEMNALRQSLNDTMEQLTTTRIQSSSIDRQNGELREQVQQLQNDLTRQSEMRDQLIAENMKSLKTIISEKELALATCKTQAAEDKKREVEMICKEKQQAIRQLEVKYSEQIAALQTQMTTRDLELQSYKERQTQQEGVTKQLIEQVKEEAHRKFQELLIEERSRWDKEKEAEVSLQLLSIRDEAERTTRQLRDNVIHERSVVQSCHRQMDALRTELEDARLTVQQASRDKQIAIGQLRDAIELEKEHQITVMKDKIEQETQLAMDKMREAVRRQDEELERLRKERKELQSKEEEMTRATDKYEQTILNELQQEYQRLSQAFNKSFRTVSPACFQISSSIAKTNNVSQTAVRSSVASVLASLRMVCDELRQELQQLRQESENQQQTALKLEKQHKAEIEDLREKWQKEKLDALETLKDRLIKENADEVNKVCRRSAESQRRLQNAVREGDAKLRQVVREQETWKSDMVERLDRKFREELNKELEKRLKKHRSSSRMLADHDIRTGTAHLSRDSDGTRPGMDSRYMTSSVPISTSGSAERGSPAKGHRVPSTPPPSIHSDVDEGRHRYHHSSTHAASTQLQTESTSLRRSGKFSSSPDLTAATGTGSASGLQTSDRTPGQDGIASTGPANRQMPQPPSSHVQTRKDDQPADVRDLELAVHRAENRVRLAEDRASRNDQLLNQKLIETSRLQGTLVQQSKELMQLQRAYTQLQRSSGCSTSPTRYASPPSRHHSSV